jgi:hypothetical protein
MSQQPLPGRNDVRSVPPRISDHNAGGVPLSQIRQRTQIGSMFRAGLFEQHNTHAGFDRGCGGCCRYPRRSRDDGAIELALGEHPFKVAEDFGIPVLAREFLGRYHIAAAHCGDLDIVDETRVQPVCEPGAAESDKSDPKGAL